MLPCFYNELLSNLTKQPVEGNITRSCGSPHEWMDYDATMCIAETEYRLRMLIFVSALLWITVSIFAMIE